MTTGATDLTYAGVTITRCLTKSFRQETIYDESNADPIGVKLAIRVFGVASVDSQGANKGFITGASGGTTAEMSTAIRHALWQPRQALVMTMGGEDVVRINGPLLQPGQSTLQYDISNGPRPTFVEVTRIVGTRGVWVEFEVEVSYVPCSSSNYILNNRWSVSDDINDNHYTTRTIDGTIRFATVAVTQQEIRSYIIPPLVPGFIRKNIHVATTPDGLTVKYRVVDEEFYTSPPSPLTKFTGTHTVSTAENGICSLGEIVVRGEGPKDVDKRSVITRCVQIAYSRINLLSLDRHKYLLEQAAIIEHLHENVAEFRLRVKFLGDLHTKGMSIDTSVLGKPLELQGYTPAAAQPMPVFGTASPAGLILCYLQSPCNANHGIGQGSATGDTSNTSTSPAGGSSPLVTTSSLSSDIEKEPSKYSAEHKESLYTHYRIESIYRTTQSKVQLPIAKESKSTGKTSVCIPLSRPVTQRKIVVSAERVGDWPKLPAPKDFTEGGSGGGGGDVQATLLDYEIDPRAPTPGPDSSQTLYALDAWYLYALDRPVPEGAAYNSGSLPWDTSKLNENTLPAQALAAPGTETAIA